MKSISTMSRFRQYEPLTMDFYKGMDMALLPLDGDRVALSVQRTVHQICDHVTRYDGKDIALCLRSALKGRGRGLWIARPFFSSRDDTFAQISYERTVHAKVRVARIVIERYGMASNRMRALEVYRYGLAYPNGCEPKWAFHTYNEAAEFFYNGGR